MNTNTMQAWVTENTKLVPTVMEVKTLTNSIYNKLNDLFSNATNLNKKLTDLDLYNPALSIKDIETINIQVSDLKIQTIVLKNKYKSLKIDTLTAIKNITKFATYFYKHETKDFKYVTEKTEYNNTVITAGINEAINNNPIEDHTADPTTVAEAESGITEIKHIVNPNNIIWDINENFNKLDKEFDNLLNVIDTLIFTIKSIKETLKE